MPILRALLLPLPLLALACGGPQVCAEMPAGLPRDSCFRDRIQTLPADQIQAVMADANEIQDPMVRGEAVTTWVQARAAQIPPAEGQALCRLLNEQDTAWCQRRLSSPHLQR
jgi:hypothetical protein